MPERIAGFIMSHHVMTVATVSGGEPWCANLFYSYMREENLFVFTSDHGTRHGKEMAGGGLVAASIVLETRSVGKVQGLQLQGSAVPAGGDMLKKARASYLKRFPYAAVAELNLHVLRPSMFKLTDNRLGFGRKLYWFADGVSSPGNGKPVYEKNDE